MALGRRRRERGGIDAWPGYVDALSTLLMVIIFVLLVFVLAQGFLSVALSSRDRALDRLNRQVAELGELLALERGQAEELRAALGRTGDELRAAVAARDAAQRSVSLLREERDRLAAERDATRGERDRLAARIADLETAARGGAGRIAELESRLAEALARTEAVGGDAARTARTLTDAQRLLAAERAALEAVRRDLAGQREQAATLGRDLDAERRAREMRERELAAAQADGQALARDLREARLERDSVARGLEAERQALAAARMQGQALARELAETRAARDTATRERDVTREELEARRREAEALARDLAAARQSLEAAQEQVAALREEATRLDRTVLADRATIEARLSDIASLTQQIRALEALRDQLERSAAQALARAEAEQRQRTAAERAAEEAARARAAAEALVAEASGRAQEAERQRTAAALLAAEAAQRAAEEERRRQAAEGQRGEFARLSESARAQVALLTRQLEELRNEIGRLSASLELREAETRDRDAQIALLGQRLNAALAARVEELQGYRSDFFGRLRRVLGDRPEVRIVGDRFVFQSEVLFPVGGAELSPAGAQQIRDLGRVLLELAAQFPRDLNWVLRVDGHADRTPIRPGGRFANNWELSAARALAVTQLLIAEGLPPNRVAAAAFGDTQPLDDRDTTEAFARNRRIEMRLEAGPAPAETPPAGVQPASLVRPAPSLAEALRGMECARIGVSQDQGGAPLLAGVAPRGTAARLPGLVPSGSPAPVLAVAEFDGPFCGVLDALRPVEPGGVRLAVAGQGPLPQGTLLRVDLGLPDWPAHLLLIFLVNDGQVVVLEQLARQAPGARIRLGEPRGGFQGWAVDAPFGTDLVLAVASEGPLFEGAFPAAGHVRDFAPALREAVAAARARGRRVATGVAVVEVVPR